MKAPPTPPGTAAAKEQGDLYLALKLWDPNGGLTPDNTQATIDFFTTLGGLPAGLKTNDVADLSYLNAVLDEIGQKWRKRKSIDKL